MLNYWSYIPRLSYHNMYRENAKQYSIQELKYVSFLLIFKLLKLILFHNVPLKGLITGILELQGIGGS